VSRELSIFYFDMPQAQERACGANLDFSCLKDRTAQCRTGSAIADRVRTSGAQTQKSRQRLRDTGFQPKASGNTFMNSTT